jgi:MYXO-CTERM domain-containing protein
MCHQRRVVVSVLSLLAFTALTSAPHAGAATIFSEDFSDDAAGWSLGPEWQIGPAATSTGHAYGNPDPATDHTAATADNGVAGVVIGGNANHFDVHFYYWLTSPTFDARGYDSVSLEYWRWLNSDYEPFMINRVEAFDGEQWQLLWQSGAAPGVTDAEWIQQSFDLTAHANATTAVRFGFRIDSGNSMIVSGWNVDDVTVTGVVPEPTTATAAAAALAALATRRRRQDVQLR